jgi:hypothetical protein
MNENEDQDQNQTETAALEPSGAPASKPSHSALRAPQPAVEGPQALVVSLEPVPDHAASILGSRPSALDNLLNSGSYNRQSCCPPRRLPPGKAQVPTLLFENIHYEDHEFENKAGG